MPLSFICAAALAIDGDTLRCANISEANGRVRLARIDAAEMDSEAGQEAKRVLARLITGPVHCQEIDADPKRKGYQARDPFRRIVARCWVGRMNLGREMLHLGQARVWP